MLRPALLLSAFAVLGAQAADLKIGAHTFTVPDGFEIDVVAGPPLVDRPITVAFDESGALYVADSSGSNDKVQKQLVDKPHRILRLVDRDGDGRFDDRTVFVDRIMFPEGTMWLDGSLYVSAPPQIWKFTDGNADGVAEKQEVWFDGKTLTNCANDLHGPYPGPDGYIYWCKGAFAEQRYQVAGGQQLVTRASHLFRARPDGSGLESVMTGGMDNPVDVVFTPSGERFVSGTFFVHPGGGQRDGILHAVYGGIWGKDHAVLDGHRRTGELMPIMTHLGPAAAAGLELRRAGNWGAEWEGNVFACHFNLRKVSRHVLQKAGATFSTTDSDFVVSDQADFHPTDVVESPDGNMLIVDTGGWYKLCCPTSQLHKPDVLGAIYRVRKKGATPFKDARDFDWPGAKPADLATLLADPRSAARDRAMAALAKAGETAVSPLAAWLNTPRPGASTTPTGARLNAIWTLTRISGESARAAVRFAFADGDPGVRAAACQSAGLWRDSGATEALINHLKHADLQVRRAAAEALGRIGDARAAKPIVEALYGTNDRFLDHSCAFALMELGAIDAARTALATKEPAALRAGLVTLHDLGALQPQELLAQLASPHPETRRIAQRIAGHHPEWSAQLASWVKERVLAAQQADAPSLQTLLGQLAANPAMQELIGELALVADTKAGSRQADLIFGAMRESVVKQLPPSWQRAVVKALAEPGETASAALEAVRPFASRKEFPKEIGEAIERLTNDSSAPPALRLAAFAALPAKGRKVSAEVFSLLMAAVRSGELLRAREAAAQLALVDLSREQLTAIAEYLPQAGAGLVTTLLEVFRGKRDEETDRELLTQLAKLASPPAPIIRSVLSAHPESIRAAAEALLAKGANPAPSARFEELAAALPKGDVRRGHLLFQSPRSACATCHAMAYTGGTLGPDLTKIGSARNERDLLEAIIFPSTSFVRSYEPLLVKTKAGAEHLGIVKKENLNEVILATGPQTETRIPRADVQAMEPAPVSLMPPGYDGIFTPQELADLVAFLKASK
jgi:putative membrane-bound dehydrogenase-like protein